MFDSQTNSMVCLNGLSLRRDSLHSASNARFLLDSMFEFAERLNSLRLTDQELGLFCAVVVIAPGKFSLYSNLIKIIHFFDCATSCTINNLHLYCILRGHRYIHTTIAYIRQRLFPFKIQCCLHCACIKIFP